MMKVLRNDVLLANLEPVVGSEQGKIRPVLVIQNENYVTKKKKTRSELLQIIGLTP